MLPSKGAAVGGIDGGIFGSKLGICWDIVGWGCVVIGGIFGGSGRGGALIKAAFGSGGIAGVETAFREARRVGGSILGTS